MNASNKINLDCRQPVCTGRQGGDPREILYCTFDGDHTWPRSAGQNESALWGNRLMWEFFVSHSHCTENSINCGAAYVPPGGDSVNER